MKYLSIDLEATGLEEDDSIIEFACVPFCTEAGLDESLAFHTLIRCPSYEELLPRLSPWVRSQNKQLIEQAHLKGIPKEDFRRLFTEYLESKKIGDYFNRDKKKPIVLFGKSMNAIDLPFLSRDLGWNYMRSYFHYQVVDISCIARAMVDARRLPPECVSGSNLMKHFQMGKVPHTALEDSINAAKLYLHMLNLQGTPS